MRENFLDLLESRTFSRYSRGMFLDELNKEQRAAVTHQDGPLLIVAGAGTGKTTVITQRIAYLILEGLAKTEEILALTFTEKAAGEMEERVDRLLPSGYVDLWISTFHSFCEKILKAHGLEIGLPNNFKLLDTTAQWILLRKNLDRFNLDYYRPLGNPTKFIHALLMHFSRAKDELISAEKYLEYAQDLELNADNRAFINKNISGLVLEQEQEDIKKIIGNEISRLKEIANAYHLYQQLLLENNALDFGDLMNYTIELLKKRPLILKKYQQQFRYVLVDEFQDTNLAQYELIKMIGKPDNNLTVCADDDQSIYKFRGASVANVLTFKKDYPKAKEVFLVQNYRSAQEILDLSYEFIKQNDPNRLEYVLNNPVEGPQNFSVLKKGQRFSKQLISEVKHQGTIEHIHAHTQYEETELVAKKIIEIIKNKREVSWGDFAILVRANNSAAPFVNTFSKHKIPHQFFASRGLYLKPIILDIMAFLRVLVDHYDSISLFRIFVMPFFGILQEDLAQLNYIARRKSISLYEAAKRQLNTSAIGSILGLIDKLTSFSQEKPTSETVLAFLEESGYLQWIQKQDEVITRENLRILNQFYKEILLFEELAFQEGSEKNVQSFLEYMELCLESGDQGNLIYDPEEGPDVVKIMTIHAAKGLEFPYVFVVGLVDKRFPTIERKDPIILPDALVKEILPEGDIHLEEERRLFYVAMTRAKQGLYLTSADDYGGTRKKRLSRFLIELGYKQSQNVPQMEYVNTKLMTFSQKSERKIFIPTQFSFTQLRTFETCPWQYKFGFVYKIPRRGNANMSYGRTMHATLQQFFELAKERRSKPQGMLFANSIETDLDSPLAAKIIDVVSEKELLEIYDQKWIDDWYESKEQKRKFYKKGKRALKKFYRDLPDDQLVPKYLEKEFCLKIGDYSLRGVIDRIDEDDKTIEIIDYKTGGTKEKLNLEDKEQLLIYQLAAIQVLKERPKKLTFYYLDSGTRISFLGSDKELDQIKKKILKTIDGIRQEKFDPKPSVMCKFCDYKNICEYRKT